MKQVIGKLFLVVGICCIAFFMWLMERTQRISIPPNTKDVPVKEETSDDKTQMVHIERTNGEALDLDIETYLEGVVGSEMPAHFEVEALKAQAVAARTFVSKRAFVVDDTTASQVYHSEEERKQIWKDNYDTNTAKVKQAVMETQGEVLTYQGELITAAFFSSCNGFTNNSEDYWKDARGYLRSVESPWDIDIEGYEQSVSFTTQAIADALGFQKPISTIEAITPFENGYIQCITIDGIVFTGREIREKLSLRSSAFDIVLKDEKVIVNTYGFGHGIGMSQYGAQGMALEGNNYQDILYHYYQDVEITQLHV